MPPIPYRLDPLGISVRERVPLTLTAAESSTVKIIATGSPTTSGLKYRPGASGTWIPYAIGTELAVAAGRKIQFRNFADTLSSSSAHHCKFVMTGSFEASGDLQSMLNYGKVCKAGSYYSLFDGAAALLTAPDLTAQKLEDRAMVSTFRGCSNLGGGVIVQATVLTGESCCLTTFYGCPKLTGAELRATRLAAGCFAYMFYGCSALRSLSVGFTGWLAGATERWMTAVSSTGTFAKPAALPDVRGANNIPNGWTAVNK